MEYSSAGRARLRRALTSLLFPGELRMFPTLARGSAGYWVMWPQCEELYDWRIDAFAWTTTSKSASNLHSLEIGHS